jgi:molybdopterin synthase sulfur carrier subunit
MIRITLPYHLRTLARVSDEVELALDGRATLGSVLDALETRYPVLRGAIRDRFTLQRRPFVRFYACREDLSHESLDTMLPAAVVDGLEPCLIVGAIAGG